MRKRKMMGIMFATLVAMAVIALALPVHNVKAQATPYITGVDPAQLVAQPTRQWLGILGTGFVSQSEVILRIGSDEYHIPSDRTQFVSSTKINVFVGLTVPGTWTAQVVNPGDGQSNIFSFTVILEVTAAIDGDLLNLIDQYAEEYYNKTWNLTLNQYKAWITTIAWGEGGKGGYTAHSQTGSSVKGLNGDRFNHINESATKAHKFRFSTGIGPFQIDRGGYGYDKHGPYGK